LIVLLLNYFIFQREGKTEEDADEGKKRKGSESRKGHHPQMKLKVDEDLANKISLFLAYPTPIIKVLIDTTTVLLFNHSLPLIENKQSHTSINRFFHLINMFFLL
jgi:hypothetical protein